MTDLLKEGVRRRFELQGAKQMTASAAPPHDECSRRSSLGYGEGQRAAGSTTATSQIAGIATRGVDRYRRGSRAGDQISRNRYLQLLAAHDGRAERRAIDAYNRRRDKLLAIHSENETLLRLGERNAGRRQRSDDRRWPGTSAQWIERVTSRKKQHCKSNRPQMP
jgi:hypothetical protein